MKEIKFRGKRIDNGEWVYGCLTRYSEEISYITVDLIRGKVYDVDPKTVGQYTGLKDKKGVSIYAGDIVRVKSYNNYFNTDVNYVQWGYLPFRNIDEKFAIGDIEPEESVVIGNIHENQNLLN